MTKKLANTFNTMFGNIAKNLKVQREKCYHEIIFNNPGDAIFNSILHLSILRIKDIMQQRKFLFSFSIHYTRVFWLSLKTYTRKKCCLENDIPVNLIKDNVSFFCNFFLSSFITLTIDYLVLYFPKN